MKNDANHPNFTPSNKKKIRFEVTTLPSMLF